MVSAKEIVGLRSRPIPWVKVFACLGMKQLTGSRVTHAAQRTATENEMLSLGSVLECMLLLAARGRFWALRKFASAFWLVAIIVEKPQFYSSVVLVAQLPLKSIICRV